MTNRLGNESSHTPVVVERPDDVVLLAERLARSPLIGIDTESNSMHCYFEKVCFLQIQAGQETFIVDTGTIIQGPPIGTDTPGQSQEGPSCLGATSH